jgi:N-methylhydantoinase B/oxoprolinase/acetone carboxylase alpha subunit
MPRESALTYGRINSIDIYRTSSGIKICDATVIGAGEAVMIQAPTMGGYGEPADNNPD